MTTAQDEDRSGAGALAPGSPESAQRNRLGVKASAVITVVTVAGIAVFVALGIRTQQAYLTAEAVRGAARLSDTIKAATYHFMLADARAEAYRTMDTIGQLEGIQQVRVLNKEGRVTFSTDRMQTGRLVDKSAEACYGCHAAGQPLVRLNLASRSRVYRQNGHRVLGMVTPIYNDASCSSAACHVHQPAQHVLGVVDVGLSLEDEDRAVADLGRRTILFGVLGVFVIAVTTGAFVHGYVIRPVRGMLTATQRIARGDLEQAIAVSRTDELGELATSFNAMTAALRAARADLQRLNERLEQQVEDRTAALRDAQAQLVQAEKLSSLGRLAASVAHEINNPLAGILTYAKLLIRLHEEGELTGTARESCVRNLRLVQRETERCRAIVRDLLDFARQRAPSLKPVDLSTVAEEGLSLLAHRLQMQKVTLERHLPPMPPVSADFGQLRQAFVNVALNACEAMAAGGALRVSTASVGGHVELTIADTGPGVPPEHLSRALDPFFTTKEKGTGLGLSVAYGVVDRHGGTLDIRSQVGQGTTVVMRLPVAGPDAPRAS